MLICIDSCVFIRGLGAISSAAMDLLLAVGSELPVVIPRLIASEVTRNLSTPEQIRTFYKQFNRQNFAFIVEEPVPRALLFKYINLGLPAKADAYIGAFAEWLQVDYLISDNRHFLRDLQTDAYQVVNPATFLKLWQGTKS